MIPLERSRPSVDSMPTALRLDYLYFESWKGQNFFFSPANRFSSGNDFPFMGGQRLGMKVRTRFHLAQSLRMSGAVHLLPLYAFMVLTEQFYLLYLYCRLEYDSIQSRKRRFRFHGYFRGRFNHEKR